LRSINILFVASKGNKKNPSPIILNQIESLNNFNGFSIKIFGIGSGLVNYLKSIRSIRNSVNRTKYDLIHAHYGLCGIIALFGKSSEKLVVSFMGDDLIGTVGKNRNYTLSSRIFAYVSKFLAKHCYDFVIVKSQNLFNTLEAKNNITIIPNGVNIIKFSPVQKEIAQSKLNLNKNTRYIIFVSNPDRPEKNYKLAAKSVKMLNLRDLELLPVYNVSNDLLRYYYSAAECLVLPSFHEGSPNVIKEAMACNCPIVATNVGDVEYVFGDTEGCYISSYDPKVFSEKINQALNFAETKGRTNGRERILELGLDSESIAQKLIAVYKKVLANKNKKVNK